MKTQRFWEKPWKGKSAEPGRYAWTVGHRWLDRTDGNTYTASGYGRTKAEAKRDLKCNKMHCDYKHAKAHKVVYEEVV